MNEINYSSNSNVSKVNNDARVKPEKVVTGEVVVNKKSLGRKIADTFTIEDNHSVVEHLIFDVVVPTTKALVVDLVTQGLERKFYGSGVRGHSGSYLSRGSYTNYTKVAKEARKGITAPITQKDKADHRFDSIEFESRGEAELTIDKLTEQIQNYDVATVSDLYSAIGLTSDFPDEGWGWTDLRGANIRRSGGRYLLNLPKPQPID